ncbi:hypothetical protein BDR26DRAFT_1001311 [Obelidium mucronatum]|nr:hypothetical protein BDR26DRAFT_1001311 [Obelidium mucronatum]
MTKSLPHEVQLDFPLLSQQSGVDLEIIEDIGVDLKMGPELRLNHLLPSAGHSAAEVPLKSAKPTMDASGCGHPEIIYSDKCCDDRGFLTKLFPSLQSRVKGLDFSSPATDFEVVYYGRENTTSLGLKCSMGKVPVLTFAVNQPKPFTAFVNLDTTKLFPLELKTLLEHKNVTKIGSHVFHDARHLLNDYGIKLKEEECIRLEKLCKKNKWTLSTKVGMKKMAENVVGLKMKKDEGIRTGKWNKKDHTKEEIAYAIDDATIGLLIYERANLASPADSISDMSPQLVSPTEPFEVITRVLLDPFHFMQGIQRLLPSPKKHPASGAAMKAFRDAIFMINDDDQMNVEAVLKDQFNGMTFEEMFVKDPDWLLKRVCRLIPLVSVLMPQLEQFLATFSAPEFTYQGIPVFSEAAIKELRQHMEKHVSAGCLSDPPGISLYRIIGHYDHFLFDYINDVAQRLYGEPILSWWSIPAVRTITSESFGVAPCVPVNQQDIFEENAVKAYPSLHRFVAVCQKLLIPFTAVSTVEEMGLFKKHIPEYYGKAKRGLKAIEDADWVKMATDWNSGMLVDCTGRALSSFFEVYGTARKRRLMIDANQDPLMLMRQSFVQHPPMSVKFLGAVSSKPLGHLDILTHESDWSDDDFPNFNQGKPLQAQPSQLPPSTALQVQMRHNAPVFEPHSICPPVVTLHQQRVSVPSGIRSSEVAAPSTL